MPRRRRGPSRSERPSDDIQPEDVEKDEPDHNFRVFRGKRVGPQRHDY